MEQNENQYEDSRRRKLAFLAGGILVILAAILLVFWLFADRTTASTGEGEAVRITPDRIEQISEAVTERVLDTLSTDILADRIRKAASDELKGEKIYELLKDAELDAVAIGDDELRDLLALLLADLGISGDGMLSEEQKKYIRLAVEKALQEALAEISVSQLLTEEEKRQLEERLKKELSETLKVQMQNGSYTLSEQELERIKNALQLQSLGDIKAPVKGVDYFTKEDISQIQDKVLKAASQEIYKQIEKLTKQIQEVRANVRTLTKQIKELKALDKEKTADIKKLQTSVTNINQSIRQINSVTEQLTKEITVSGGKLERVTGSGSEIRSEKVLDADLTIAQFVDILAGNDRIYTGAIQELDRLIKQLKEENAKQDSELDKAVKELEHSLDDNGKALEDTKEALEKSDKELKEQLDSKSGDLERKLEEEKKAREETDKKLQEQADAADKLTGDPKDAGKLEGDTVFEKIGAIVRILSKDGISGLFNALQGIGGAETVEEGMENLHNDLQDARTRVSELEREKWLSGITLLADPQQEGDTGYAYQESGLAYVYQIPIVTEEDQISLDEDETTIVVEFKRPDRLPSNAALSTSGNMLLIAFTNKPSRNIEIVSIHVYREQS